MKTAIITLVILSSTWTPSAYFLTEVEHRVESMTGRDIAFEIQFRDDPSPELNYLNSRAERLYSLRRISPRRSRKITHYILDLLEGNWIAGRAPVCSFHQSYAASFSTAHSDVEELSIRAAAQELGHDLGLRDGPACTGMDDQVLRCGAVDYSLQLGAERFVNRCTRRLYGKKS